MARVLKTYRCPVCLQRYSRYKGHLRVVHGIENEATIAKLETLARAEDTMRELIGEVKAFREAIEPKVEAAIEQLTASQRRLIHGTPV